MTEEPKKSVYQICSENFNNRAQLLKTLEEFCEDTDKEDSD